MPTSTDNQPNVTEWMIPPINIPTVSEQRRRVAEIKQPKLKGPIV